MQILVDHKPVIIKKGTAFDFVAENRLFGGADSYTLNISFPLRGCLENQKVFGQINRPDTDPAQVHFDCEIIAPELHRLGTLVITDISEVEIKAQFLEGRSAQNFDVTFENIFINELDLGRIDRSGALHHGGKEPDSSDFVFDASTSQRPSGETYDPNTDYDLHTPEEVWAYGAGELTYVALPWVNNNDPNGVGQNFVEWDGSKYIWNQNVRALSWQPYLIFIAKQIAEACGYTYDFAQWEEDNGLSHLLICNTLPSGLNVQEIASALPHWSVKEFFQKLELLLDGSFDIDHKAKSIAFSLHKTALSAAGEIHLKEVLDAFSQSIEQESSRCEYNYAKNLKYADGDYREWKYLCCPWFMKTLAQVNSLNSQWPAGKNGATTYETLDALLAANKGLKIWTGDIGKGSNRHRVMYARDVDLYFICRIYEQTIVEENNRKYRKCRCSLQALNTLGPRIVDESEDAQEEELDIVPVRIDFTEDKYGRCIFLDVKAQSTGQFNSGESSSNDIYESPLQTFYEYAIEAGEQENKPEYFDKIYIGYWDGAVPTNTLFPHPFVETVNVAADWESYVNAPFSLRLNDPREKSRGPGALPAIDPKRKFTFSFLLGSAENKDCEIRGIPEPRAVYNIRGKRYLCAKLTASVSERGVSDLIKGEFYRILDENS